MDDAILDGEVIVADGTGRPVFIDLLRRNRPPGYVVFDILWLKRHRPPASAAQRAPAQPTEHSSKGITGRFRGAVRRGQGPRALRADARARSRGVVAKRLTDPYDPRTRWLKIKTQTTRRRKAGATFSTGHRSGEPQALDDNQLAKYRAAFAKDWVRALWRQIFR